MATSMPTLAVGRGLVAARVSRLNSDGTRDCSATDGSAYSLCVQSITPSTQIEAGETETIDCGDGTTAATVVTDDTITAIELTMEVTKDDIEFIERMVGGVMLDDSGTNIGISQRSSSVSSPVFELHAWEEARSGSALVNDRPYFQHVWGNCTARLGDKPISSGFGTRQVIITVQGTAGASLGNGSFLDIPVGAFDGDADGGLYSYFRVASSAVPDADTSPYNNGAGGGYIDTPACSS